LLAEGFVRPDQAMACTAFVLLTLFLLATVLTIKVSPGGEMSGRDGTGDLESHVYRVYL
jgi:hypothetical protein